MEKKKNSNGKQVLIRFSDEEFKKITDEHRIQLSFIDNPVDLSRSKFIRDLIFKSLQEIIDKRKGLY